MIINILSGYMSKGFGNKNTIVADIYGPDYYFTGGSEYSVDGLNIGAFESVQVGVSQSGNYRAEARFDGNGAQQTFKLVVFVISTGLQVAYGIDLGDEVFRATIIGV